MLLQVPFKKKDASNPFQQWYWESFCQKCHWATNGQIYFLLILGFDIHQLLILQISWRTFPFLWRDVHFPMISVAFLICFYILNLLRYSVRQGRKRCAQSVFLHRVNATSDPFCTIARWCICSQKIEDLKKQQHTWSFSWLEDIWLLESKSNKIGIFWCQHLHDGINQNIYKLFLIYI